MLTVSWVLLVVGLVVAAFVGSAGMLLALSLVSMKRQPVLEPPYDDDEDDEGWGGDYASIDGPTEPVPPPAPAVVRTAASVRAQVWAPTIGRTPRPWETGPLELELDHLHTGVEEIEEGPGLWN
ncbi:MAG TPA: hypothetical protein VFU72_08840 [Nitrolancea sp.]|nr:hypothetical protein [Nitrolancea sp.]